MNVLVAYASKHGATREIAERIADGLTRAGQQAEARPVASAGDLRGYDAVVVGSAAYNTHWLRQATAFVRAHHDELAARPVWLFSSGPLGTKPTDPRGRDLRQASEPKEVAGLRAEIGARGHQVFFGALDPRKLTLFERSVRRLPAGRALLPEGDFRDWDEIRAWAEEIAHDPALTGAPPGS